MTRFWLRFWGGFVITLVIFILQTDYILGLCGRCILLAYSVGAFLFCVGDLY